MLPVPIPTLKYGDRGSIYYNRLRDDIRGRVAVPASAQVPMYAAARSGSANGMASTCLEAPSDSWMEVFSLFGVSNKDSGGSAVNADVTARQCMTITEYTSGQRAMMRRPVNCTHIFGTQKNPLMLDDPYCEPLMIPPQGIVRFDLVNPSTAGGTGWSFGADVRLINVEALEKDPSVKAAVTGLYERRKRVSPVWIPLASDAGATTLGVPGLNIAASGSQYANFITFSNAPTEVLITRIMGSFVSAGVAGNTQDGFAMDLYDARTYRQLNTQPIVFGCGAGPATFPYILPTPIVISSNQVVKGRFYNLITDASIDIFVTLQGIAVND